jgi:plasmid maintenance system antidote protein VapI
MGKKSITAEELRQIVADAFEHSQLSQRKFASTLGVSQQYLNDLVNGKRMPGPAIALKFGYEAKFVKIGRGKNV